MDNYVISQTATSIWSITDLLRGDFKQSQYGRVILPFTLLSRLDCVPELDKYIVANELDYIRHINQPEKRRKKTLYSTRQTKVLLDDLFFFNTPLRNLSQLNDNDIKINLDQYLDSFSRDIQKIFEYFKFNDTVEQLVDANLLLKVVNKFSIIDLSPEIISNHEMSLIFEELIRRFAESSNETAGEHFTSRDIVRLTTSLVLMENDNSLYKDGIVHSIYDPTVGTGGFLSSAMEYIYKLNPNAVIQAFGQELNPESYAICSADILLKGQDIRFIKLGNTLSNDQFPQDKFNYMFSHPPFNMDWRKIETDIRREYQNKGYSGRFGPGLPRISDASLLFLMHLINKMSDNSSGGRIGIILSGSSLHTGGAGSGESEIRRYILENDLLEGIVALPTDIFYNTGISTYLWILSNKKTPERTGKVQLIDGTNLRSKMRKSLGSKRSLISEDDIKLITRTFINFEVVDETNFEQLSLENIPEQKSNNRDSSAITETEIPKTYASKIVNNTDFGYRRLTIERPLRLSVQITDEAIATLRFAAKPLNAPMERLYEEFSVQWKNNNYATFLELEEKARAIINAEYPELKNKQINDILDSKLWFAQRELMEKAQKIQSALTSYLSNNGLINNDFNQFQIILKDVMKALNIRLTNKETKQFIDTITIKNPEAEPVVKRLLKERAQPLYGRFVYKGHVVEFEPDSDLRDNENIPLNPTIVTSDLIEDYFKTTIQPHATDAWVNIDKRDVKDGEVGIVGYHINFQSYFKKNHTRDKLLQGNSIRFKEIVKLNTSGLYILEPLTGKIVEFSGLSKNKITFNRDRFDFHNETLIPEFYNIFLQQEEGKDWLESNFKLSSSIINISMSSWLNTRFVLPSLINQSKLIEFWNECEAVLNRVSLLKNSVFSNFQSAQEQLLPYLSATSRFENEFSSILPTPLAILWELAESKFGDRERCEAFIKFFEHLGLYLLSFIFGKNKPPKKTFYKGRTEKELISITMGFGHYQLKEYNKSLSLDNGIISLICNDEMINLLKEATSLRNDIAHRGLPSAASVATAKEIIQRLNNTMQLKYRKFFEETTLIKPIKAKFDGNSFINEVEILKGLGINPSKTAQINTLEPMISDELYLAHGDFTTSENISITKIFPLMIMSETLPESDIMGFYFYSDVLDTKLRFVCPYPNVETYKFIDQAIITDNLGS